MRAQSAVTLVSDASMPGLVWGERRNETRGWLFELQRLVEAGPGKCLQIEAPTDKQAVNRRCQMNAKARKLQVKLEFARGNGFIFVRIVEEKKAPSRPVAIAPQSDADGRALIDLVWSVLKDRVRWNSFASLAGIVSSMDSPAAKSALPKDIKQTLEQLVKSGVVVTRDEEGVSTWRAKAVTK